MRPPSFFRSSAFALLLIAAVTVAQSLLCSSIVAEQRDSAHIIGVSGAQRMRTERIAYLVATAHAGHPEPGWHALLETTITDMLDVRDKIGQDKRYALTDEIRRPAPRSPTTTATSKQPAAWNATQLMGARFKRFAICARACSSPSILQ